MGNKPEAAAGFVAHRGLIAFATGAAMAEAALLAAAAPAARVLAPQVTALPPLAVFHDLRWLYSAQRSWLEFILALAGLILARSAVNSLLVRLAWPGAVAPPAPLEALRCALGFTVFAFLLMSPVVSLTLGVAILPFSWPFLATLPVMLLIAVPLSHGGAVGYWWRMLPPPAAVGWLLADFAVLSVTAALIGRLPLPGAVPAAGLAGLVNARAWYGLTGARRRCPHPRPGGRLARRRAAGPGRASGRTRRDRGDNPADQAGVHGRHSHGDPAHGRSGPGWPGGPGAGRHGRAHGEPGGAASVPRACPACRGRPAGSATAPARAGGGGVRVMVLRARPVTCLRHAGHARAAVLLPGPRPGRSPAAVRSRGGRPAAAGPGRPHRRPGVAAARQDRPVELVPLADAVTLPACSLPSNVQVVPALHGALLDDPESLRMVRDFLTDHRVSNTARLRTTAEIVAAAASAWRIPQATTPSPPCRR